MAIVQPSSFVPRWSLLINWWTAMIDKRLNMTKLDGKMALSIQVPSLACRCHCSRNIKIPVDSLRLKVAMDTCPAFTFSCIKRARQLEKSGSLDSLILDLQNMPNWSVFQSLSFKYSPATEQFGVSYDRVKSFVYYYTTLGRWLTSVKYVNIFSWYLHCCFS